MSKKPTKKTTSRKPAASQDKSNTENQGIEADMTYKVPGTDIEIKIEPGSLLARRGGMVPTVNLPRNTASKIS